MGCFKGSAERQTYNVVFKKEKRKTNTRRNKCNKAKIKQDIRQPGGDKTQIH